MPLHAGAARLDITPQTPQQLVGYGNKERKHERVHQPLHVRALFVKGLEGEVLLVNLELLHVDEGVTFADLKGTLVTFAKQFYGSDVKYRFRPTFFPFTEPSADMYISCFIC